MEASEINEQLKNYPKLVETFARTQIPKKLSRSHGMVVNTDPSWKQGEHWVSIFIDENGYGEYFDSFGFPPLKKEVISFLSKNCVGMRYINSSAFCSMHYQYHVENIASFFSISVSGA